MKVSYNWLKELVNIEVSPRELSEQMSLYSVEVESFSSLVNVENLIIGEVLTCENHPNSDHLHICTVNVGAEVKQIICGAPNVGVGQKVIVALPGCKLPGGEITVSKIRGVESYGMLCSLQELGIENKYVPAEYQNGIYLLASDAPVGFDALDYLEYKSSNGTNLKLKLMPNHYWLSAQEDTLDTKITFTANMPTEEVFTMPSFDGVDGVVVSTKPLSLRGQLIENFKVYFENGKAVKVEAEKGQDVLEQMLAEDESSCHLGEVALVPFDSPISQSKILFYNTLFDENASCHLAFGAAYKNTLRDYEKLTEEDLKKMKFNESMNHVDFMIGSEDLDIVGTKFDGTKVQIFKNGNWAI